MTAADAALVALAAGGTGGHMFPAEALAEELKRRGYRTLLVTDARGARYAKNFPADERFEISAASPNVGGPVAKAAAALSMAGGLMTTLHQFRKRSVAAAVGFGGYPSLPAMKAAALLKIPYGVHEQNGVLGRSNRMLAADAAFLAHGFPRLERVPARHGALHDVGNPVRDAVSAHAGATYPGFECGIEIVVFGGSQGASLFSRVAPAAIQRLPEATRNRLSVVHQAREEERDAVERAYAQAGVAATIAPFFADLPQRLADAHLVIARAGASSVTELSIIGRPSVLVPLAIAMDDHQTGNARVLADNGAATIIEERDFSPETLAQALAELLEPARLADMAERARGRVQEGAAARLANLVDALVAKGAKRNAA